MTQFFFTSKKRKPTRENPIWTPFSSLRQVWGKGWLAEFFAPPPSMFHFSETAKLASPTPGGWLCPKKVAKKTRTHPRFHPTAFFFSREDFAESMRWTDLFCEKKINIFFFPLSLNKNWARLRRLTLNNFDLLFDFVSDESTCSYKRREVCSALTLPSDIYRAQRCVHRWVEHTSGDVSWGRWKIWQLLNTPLKPFTWVGEDFKKSGNFWTQPLKNYTWSNEKWYNNNYNYNNTKRALIWRLRRR